MDRRGSETDAAWPATGGVSGAARAALIVAAAAATLAAAVVLVLALSPRVGLAAAVAIGCAECAVVAGALIVLSRQEERSHDMVECFAQGFDDATSGMALVSPDGLRVVRANRAMCELLGRDREEVVGRSILDFKSADEIDFRAEERAAISAGREHGPLLSRYVRPDGSIAEAVLTAGLIEFGHGQRYVFTHLSDVTRQRRDERRNETVACLARRALETSDVPEFLGEAMEMAREALGAAECLTTQQLAGGTVRLLALAAGTADFSIPPGEPSQSAYTLEVNEPVISNDLPGEARFTAPAIGVQFGLHRGLSVPVPEPSGASRVVVAVRHKEEPPFDEDDVRFMEALARVLAGVFDRAATERELRRRAFEDPLTGLANRALLTSQLELELRNARRLGDRVCVLAVDLDGFKVINDTLGHDVGDALLRRFAAELSACVREEDVVARTGGDEFMVVCTRPRGDEDPFPEIAQRLVETPTKLLEIDGHELFLTASVGIAVSEDGTEKPEELLRDVDAAMSRAQELGGGRLESFDVTLRHRLVERRMLENELRHALARGQFELHYQPVFRLSNEEVVGFEALLRWRHPERGLVPPDDFMQIAEATGLIVPIGGWVVHEVCAQLARWPEEYRVAANLSALQIRPELVGDVERMLEYHSIAPSRLVLEITERLVLDPRIRPVVTRLRELGVKLALDDFGTGYSSLGSLQRFPLDVVKLDRTLTAPLREGVGLAIVRAAVDLGRALDVQVIAEGIEDEVQLETLRKLGCGFGQGFLFAKPAPVEEAERLMRERRTGREAA